MDLLECWKVRQKEQVIKYSDVIIEQYKKFIISKISSSKITVRDFMIMAWEYIQIFPSQEKQLKRFNNFILNELIEDKTRESFIKKIKNVR